MGSVSPLNVWAFLFGSEQILVCSWCCVLWHCSVPVFRPGVPSQCSIPVYYPHVPSWCSIPVFHPGVTSQCSIPVFHLSVPSQSTLLMFHPGVPSRPSIQVFHPGVPSRCSIPFFPSHSSIPVFYQCEALLDACVWAPSVTPELVHSAGDSDCSKLTTQLISLLHPVFCNAITSPGAAMESSAFWDTVVFYCSAICPPLHRAATPTLVMTGDVSSLLLWEEPVLDILVKY